jgi:hypothetical protein
MIRVTKVNGIPGRFYPYGFRGGLSMFDTLADRIREDQRKEVTPRERFIQYALVVVIAVTLFGGLYWAIHALE